MDYDDLMILLKKRRSIRRFKPDPIPNEYLDKIIEAARWAPSGMNLQPWEFVIIKDPDLKNKIVEFIDYAEPFRQKMEATRESWQKRLKKRTKSASMSFSALSFSTAPVFILLLGDTRTKAGLPMSDRFSAELSQSLFNSGLANAFLYMHLAATTLGLGRWRSFHHLPYSQGRGS